MTCGRKPAALRVLAVAALAGQLAALADALLVAHVTCLAHGDRIHAVTEPPAAPPTGWARLHQLGADADGHDHAQCLLDDDVDFVPSPPPCSLAAPDVHPSPPLSFQADLPSGRRLAVYRLAPKNSPPG